MEFFERRNRPLAIFLFTILAASGFFLWAEYEKRVAEKCMELIDKNESLTRHPKYMKFLSHQEDTRRWVTNIFRVNPPGSTV